MWHELTEKEYHCLSDLLAAGKQNYFVLPLCNMFLTAAISLIAIILTAKCRFVLGCTFAVYAFAAISLRIFWMAHEYDICEKIAPKNFRAAVVTVVSKQAIKVNNKRKYLLTVTLMNANSRSEEVQTTQLSYCALDIGDTALVFKPSNDVNACLVIPVERQKKEGL